MANNQAKLAISPVKTGIWFAVAAVPFLLVAAVPLLMIVSCACVGNSAISGQSYIVSSILALALSGIPPMLFSCIIGAFIGRIFLQQQNKLIGLLSGPIVAVLTGAVLAICYRVWMAGSGYIPGVADVLGQAIFIGTFLVYAICALVIGAVLTFCKKLIVEKQ